jgi:IclR family transcriptional regulator, KDG regulon repressor
MAGSKAGGRARPAGPAEDRARYQIQALDRAASILNCFDIDHPELSVRAISERTGLHKSTTHRILMALQLNGLVEQDAGTGPYHLGLQLVKLGDHAVARLDVRQIARPFMTQLAADTSATVHLAVMDGDQVFITDRVESPSGPGTPSLPGRLFPAHSTALGKAMQAGMDDVEIRRLLGPGRLKVFTPRTLKTVDALLRDLRGVRQRGFATSDQEIVAGLCTAGAAILNHSGAIVAAISVGFAPMRARAATFAAMGEKVKRTAAAISARLGHGGLERRAAPRKRPAAGRPR